ncbi:class I SAM-dependent methyltransferase [Streptomyces sp. LP05-1]|uniref:Class I SAM-dependent methyltransferase n=1 Tax=Streptomyces pyxinae TaxID=2970734 RepID=A0ABT2CJW4_9ACTN|nr:class I SAM-dependent methyltransferase [Streptomyces sp. LP05-1]MCS0637006.1 class I SAM-dependent methyltransferase [Streptomyces sp. LP05-1]
MTDNHASGGPGAPAAPAPYEPAAPGGEHGPPRLTGLAFHGPLSEARAGRLVARLAAGRPATVLDIGCGWGELLLRLLAALPGATGTGLDIDAEDLARGRRLARERGLAERVAFARESALRTARGPADLVLCLGAGQALRDPDRPYDLAEVLRELRRLVVPGGRVLLGEGFWQRAPTPAELAAMWPGARADDHPSLGGLVERAVTAGFRPVRIETANEDEWEEFESGYREDTESWLAAHPGHPSAAGIGQRVDRQRASWLDGYRGVLGIAYLTLAPVRE